MLWELLEKLLILSIGNKQLPSALASPLTVGLTHDQLSVSDLRETDTFNLVLFSGASVQMADKSLPASLENIQRAVKMIDDQEGGGGTELAPALRDALAIPASEEVLEKHCHHYGRLYLRRGGDFEIIHQHIGDADFFPFGIGRGGNRYLIEGIAKTGQENPLW